MAANSMGYLQIDIPQITRNIASFSPTLSAIIISLIVYGREGLRRTLNGLGTWRLNPVWYLLIFLEPSIVGLIAIGINSSLGGTIPSFFQFYPFSMLPVIFLYVLILGGALGEEIGWRGYALPRLSRKPGRIMGTFSSASYGVYGISPCSSSKEVLRLPSLFLYSWCRQPAFQSSIPGCSIILVAS